MSLVTRKDFSFSPASKVTWETVNNDNRESDTGKALPAHAQVTLPVDVLTRLSGQETIKRPSIIRRAAANNNKVSRDVKPLNKDVISSQGPATTSVTGRTTVHAPRVSATAAENIRRGLADHFNEYHAFAGGFMLVISLASIAYYTFTTYYLGNADLKPSHLNVIAAAIVDQGKLAGLVIRDIRQTGTGVDPRRNAEKRVRAMAQMEFEHRLGQYYLGNNASLRSTRASQPGIRKLPSPGPAMH
ncbi:MAG: hypothetical protein BMS9Abin26_0034 [Gammaproteobacteria bacterium]|nr:MAG: hypothetical protein BMS9Abin26_0034 [Gammaproteobacteria bacterium]